MFHVCGIETHFVVQHTAYAVKMTTIQHQQKNGDVFVPNTSGDTVEGMRKRQQGL